jgi:hypothetical protein
MEGASPSPGTAVVPTQDQQPTMVYESPTTEPSSPNPPVESGLEPIREHYQVSVGEGLFSEGTFSDGMAPYSEEWLWDNDRFDIQMIRIEEQPEGCDVARYDTELVWISGSPGMSVTVDGEEVGTYTARVNAHGYIFQYPISMGDRICAVDFSPTLGFHIIIGPDIYFHYDSYCYRGHC